MKATKKKSSKQPKIISCIIMTTFGVYWNFDFYFNEIFKRFKLIGCQSGGKMYYVE